jgi:hypothetical protein
MNDSDAPRPGAKPLKWLVAAAAVTAISLAIIRIASPSSAADDIDQTRNLTSFDKIQTSGAFRAVVRAGQPRTRVVVSAARDTVDRVTTEVRDGTLYVGMRSADSWPLHSAPKITVDLPALRGFENQGIGSAEISGVSGELALVNAGTASIDVSGRASRLTITIDGAGKVDTTALDARDVTVDNNGVGSVRVRASGDLTMNVNGLGEIRYTGDPAHITSNVNGIGHIGRL